MKAINIEGINKIQATAIGSNFNQHKSINWSYLNLGKVALTKINKKEKQQVLRPKIIDCKLIIDSLTNISGIWYPPKKKIEVNELNNTIDEYSPKKKNTKTVELCSVIKPDTSSDSASCKSKGTLLDSAKTEIK